MTRICPREGEGTMEGCGKEPQESRSLLDVISRVLIDMGPGVLDISQASSSSTALGSITTRKVQLQIDSE